jgi:hypothetical protein
MKQMTKKSAFINRACELNYLTHWIHEEPGYMLFLYGPKSSGKTTLLMKFIETQLNDNLYNIKHFNLRKVFIGTYIDFIQAFFEVDYSKATEDVKKKKNTD